MRNLIRQLHVDLEAGFLDMVSTAALRAAADGVTLHELSRRFRRIVLIEETDVRWGGQNAWRRSELADLRVKHGLRTNPFDICKVMRRLREVPNIDAMEGQSLYSLAAG